MSLIDLYPALKVTHVSLVSASGALFAVRGASVLTGRAWPMHKHWRIVSASLDTLLLAAGVTLWFMLRLNPSRDAWLGVKLLLLVLYIAAGALAMRRSPGLALRAAAYGCAIGLYLFIASIAVMHNPLGALARFV
ncbi:regulator SirB [bacterium M00.F.Ca.ET.228.01.1.1]|uniref:SirB2 family protein n=1 Tax=Paraburkholderia phenoliruptrix TaxID=252970 RepID=UPI0010929AE8|nr:SirB2 family protein [Paraburkholderia phenoliruptrix]TGP47367.1 regulator SirB [bacterium M00.F.Ca.ET.228.01.1.1]TGS05159.1 regulator SirB [bacterium M00.F.Ca.ET.191.01.1.1]TGU10095.1 regulator SirB [bacterium M00.F.Ca.ET.155.01.1.1]MBW0449633.1 SirB2 family protein [Paraburkholderia phenoliruptrix]MBW9101251.1 SirB2 family protein [Paraburkholderia phenoliruptrix]